MSDSARPHRRQPTRLPRPWDSPGKNTGVGCHFLLQWIKMKNKVKSLSRVLLLATPWTAAHQASPSLGFSGQEHWSGLQFPSPVHESEKWKWSHSVMSHSLRPHGLQPTRFLHPWDFPGKSTGVGCHALKSILRACDYSWLRTPLVSYYQERKEKSLRRKVINVIYFNCGNNVTAFKDWSPTQT